jgi:hypothetical protein
MLDRVGGFMRNVGLIVRSHHERWDGDGYPDGLVGDAIPLEARIISCCDAWNAMTTTRSYRAAMPLVAAVAEMRANSGAQFDPRVVELLLAIVPHDASAAGRPAALAACARHPYREPCAPPLPTGACGLVARGRRALAVSRGCPRRVAGNALMWHHVTP